MLSPPKSLRSNIFKQNQIHRKDNSDHVRDHEFDQPPETREDIEDEVPVDYGGHVIKFNQRIVKPSYQSTPTEILSTQQSAKNMRLSAQSNLRQFTEVKHTDASEKSVDMSGTPGPRMGEKCLDNLSIQGEEEVKVESTPQKTNDMKQFVVLSPNQIIQSVDMADRKT